MTNLPFLLSTTTGTVLEIGPGSGGFSTYYTSPSIRAIYGAEPVIELHRALKESTNAAGLGDKYKILHCGGESESLIPALGNIGLLKEEDWKKENGKNEQGIFDTIVCVRVLCGVPRLASAIETLYNLLRPGGRLIICEHVINPWRTSKKGSLLGRSLQIFYQMLGWTFFVGNCHMDRDIVKLLMEAGDANGGWESVELEKSLEWSPLPFVTGVLVKKGL